MKSVTEMRISAPTSSCVSLAKFLTPVVDCSGVQRLRRFDEDGIWVRTKTS